MLQEWRLNEERKFHKQCLHCGVQKLIGVGHRRPHPHARAPGRPRGREAEHRGGPAAHGGARALAAPREDREDPRGARALREGGHQAVQVRHRPGGRRARRGAGGRVESAVVDVRDRSDMMKAAKTVVEVFGRIDVLVNNAYAGVNTIFTSSGKKFYETDPTETWDCINGVGLRGHYHCTVLASRLMVENRQVNNKKQNLNNINDKKP